MNSDFWDWFKSSAAAKRYAVIAFVICIAYYVLEYINGRAQMADFRVYYDAANAFLHDTQLYGKAFGVSSGFYKYSPFAAIPFIPLAVLPYTIASGIYYLLMTIAFIWWPLKLIHYVATKHNDFNIQKTGAIIFISVLFLADHIERELHLGNVNLFLLIASFFAFKALVKNENIKAGIIIGIIILFKPHFVILLPYLAWKKKLKSILSSIAAVFAGFLIPAVLKGWNGNIQIHEQWLQAMRDHNISLEDSPNTVYGIINRFFLRGDSGATLVLALLVVVAACFVWFLVRNKKKWGNSSIRFIEYFVLIAAIPNLAHTDTEHFMWTWPLITFAVIVLSLGHLQKKVIIIILLTLAFIPYCINSPDIVGHEVRFLFDEGGLLGVANVILILTTVYLYINRTKDSNKSLIQDF